MNKIIIPLNYYAETIDSFCADILKQRVNEKFDVFFLFEDSEGNGKSVCDIQVAKRLSPNFKIDSEHVFNNPSYDKFSNAFESLPDWDYIDIDEAGDIILKAKEKAVKALDELKKEEQRRRDEYSRTRKRIEQREAIQSSKS